MRTMGSLNGYVLFWCCCCATFEKGYDEGIYPDRLFGKMAGDTAYLYPLLGCHERTRWRGGGRSHRDCTQNEGLPLDAPIFRSWLYTDK